MSCKLLSVESIPRSKSFPFRVKTIYQGNSIRFAAAPRKWSDFEVCIRSNSEELVLEDEVDGRILQTSCPQVLFPVPGSVWKSKDWQTRDATAFNYAPEVAELLKPHGLYPDRSYCNFIMTPEISQHLSKIRNIICNLYTPGAADSLDWTCFSLLGTLRFQQEGAPAVTLENRIYNMSIGFQMHYSEPINIDDVAAANTMSRAYFFHVWKKYFPVSPLQYIINLRLEAAARSLLDTDLSIAQIVSENAFSSEYDFYRRFRKKYGMTPGEYRLRNRSELCRTPKK